MAMLGRRLSRGWLRAPIWIALFLLLARSPAHAGGPGAPPPDGFCAAAIEAAQAQYGVPSGLLFAIGQVESGRPDPLTHRLVPWPWTVQANGQSYYFDSKAEAVAWVQAAEARGIASIDVGCMQVNLHYHPAAFLTLDEAFDPVLNARYAARFLVALHAEADDWQKAAGLYHSQTLALAVPYAKKVEAAMTGRLPGAFGLPPPKPTMLAMLQAAWGSTLAGTPAAVPALAVSVWSSAPVRRPRRRFTRNFGHQRPVLLSYAH